MELVIQNDFAKIFQINFESRILKTPMLPVGKGISGCTQKTHNGFYYYPKDSVTHHLGGSSFTWSRTRKGLHRKSYEQYKKGLKFYLGFTEVRKYDSNMSKAKYGLRNEPLYHRKGMNIQTINHPQEVYNRIRKKKIAFITAGYTFPLYDKNYLPWYDLQQFAATVDTVFKNSVLMGSRQVLRKIIRPYHRTEILEMVRTVLGKHGPMSVTKMGETAGLDYLRTVAEDERAFLQSDNHSPDIDSLKLRLQQVQNFRFPEYPSLKTIMLIGYLQDIIRDTKPSSSFDYKPLKKSIEQSLNGFSLSVKREKIWHKKSEANRLRFNINF